MNYYIFQISDRLVNGNKVSAQEIFNFLVLENEQWGFGERTPNRKNIQAGDKVIFYVTGTDNQYFIGSAILKSGAYKGDFFKIERNI